MTVATPIVLSAEESSILSRYATALSYADMFVNRVATDIEMTKMEIAECEKQLAYLKERLERYQSEHLEGVGTATETRNVLVSAKMNILKAHGISQDEEHLYSLEVTPNGTAKTLDKKD